MLKRFLFIILKAIRLLIDKDYRFLYNVSKGKYRDMSDEDFIKKKFKVHVGYDLDLENPKTFNEKLNWLKLYYRKPEFTQMVDKYAVKEIVSAKIGSEHVVKALGVWDNFDDIDFDMLPDRFVLKCTQDSGGYIVCEDKNKFDKKAAKKKMEAFMKREFFWISREWPYKNVKPRILAEEYIDSLGKKDSVEYKLTCCNGIVKIVTVCGGIPHVEKDKRTNDNYDRELNHLPWWAEYKNSKVPIPITDKIQEIIQYAEILSEGIPQVRVDFYIHEGNIYFGEFTFYTWGGFIRFNPPEWDSIMGDYIVLPEKYTG